jgi:ABC-2 type transport system permease protein
MMLKRFGHEIGAVRAFVLRDFDLSKRYLGWEIVFLVYTTINAITIGLIGVSMQSQGVSDAKVQEQTLYLLVGALLWSFLSVLFMVVSETVAWERWEGTLEYTFMAPIHRLTHLLGVCVFAIIYGAIRVIAVMLLLTLFFDLDLSHANLPAAFVLLILSSVSFVGLGLVAAILPLLSPEKGPQATNIILGIFLLVSGVYYPISYLPKWLYSIAVYSPGTYALNATRETIINGAGLSSLWHEIIILIVSGLILIPLGYFIFLWGEKYAKRTGNLKRAG